MSLDEKRKQYLNVMGIPTWDARDGAFADFQLNPLDAAPSFEIEMPVEESLVDWAALRQQVASCIACDLHQSRTNTVFGVGNENAELLVIGEAPGADEDMQGEPFVGRAGKLLNEMLLAIGFRREEVFIANILKCRPPGNRDPLPHEVSQCHHFLQKQIDYIKPKLILSVGKVSSQNLLGTDETIGKLRGRVHHYGEQRIPLVATYHPAYLLRSPMEKRKSWNDLLMALRTMRGEMH